MAQTLCKDIIEYHEASKHYPGNYAESLPFLDWDNQPNPFRTYQGAPTLDLPFLEGPLNLARKHLYIPPEAPAWTVDARGIGALLELSLGLSCWKEYDGARWALRMNPSSGNLHPTEAHIISAQLDGHFHYQPEHHQLERRAELSDAARAGLEALEGGFLLGLSSVVIRESWKYGVRAFRYVQHDLGHALAAISIAANMLGWKVRLLNGLGQERIGQLLGFHHTAWVKNEAEEPEALLWIGPKEVAAPQDLPAGLDEALADLTFVGKPLPLSKDNLPWQPNEEAVSDSIQTDRAFRPQPLPERPWFEGPAADADAEALIRRRRSGQAYDPKASGTDKAHFISLLEKTVPRAGAAPFDLDLPAPKADLLLFVHNVEGMAQGTYILVRDKAQLAVLQGAFSQRFMWSKIETEANLDLYLLETGNARKMMAQVSCNQAIGGHSAFTLGMLVPFGSSLEEDPSLYRRLFWECGMVGQVLYLEAEAAGLQGTGIGCYHDNQVHEYLQLEGRPFQSFYHFTIGKALVDDRISTAPPYNERRNLK
ncbi:MAG: nitroreductase family protein [bacterium]|nr:nitroreductase family protein [bacterium]